MLRALFISVGIIFIVFGLEFLVVDRAIYAKSDNPEILTQNVRFDPEERTFLERFEEKANTNPEDFEPDDWVPWGLLSAGVVIVLYSITLRRDSGGDNGHHDGGDDN